MRLSVIAGLSAFGTIAFYVAWIVAVADDYGGGLKHFAAIATAVLFWMCLATFVVSVALLIRRWLRRRS